MSNSYEKHIKWWLGEFSAKDKYDWLMDRFPEVNTRLAKFAVGVYAWHLFGKLDLDNSDDVDRVHRMLKVIDSTSGYDFFDNVFNEASPEMVYEIIGMLPKVPRKEPPFVADYYVKEIKAYEDAHEYFDMIGWRFVVSEESFNDYAAHGSHFFICGNGDWWDVPCQTGENYPLDNYGLSFLAVEVDYDNRIRSITTRWNDTGNNGSETQLRKLLGDEFEKLGISTIQSSK